MSVNRNFGTGVFGLVLGGVSSGIVLHCRLATTRRAVTEAPVSHGLFTQRAMGNKEITPIEIEIALSGGRMSGLARFSQIFSHHAESGRRSPRFDGEIKVGNTAGKCVERQLFFNALVTSFSFGDLDARAKNPATFKVTLEPERIENVSGDNSDIPGGIDTVDKSWSAANFRVTAAGLSTSRVTKVYGWTTRLTTTKQYVGEQDLPELIPGNFEFPKDGKLDLAVETAEAWRGWHKRMVVDGDDQAEKDIVVEYLDTTLKQTLLTVTYHQCGISALADQPLGGNDERLKITTATLHCRRIGVKQSG